ncbi:MAG TPA: hypothetical protein VM511_02165 [Luteolibacter sp.]|nr:hypothetical protein [Luteolibacter sp.]
MMIRSFSLGVFCCVAVSSCDKAKDIATKASKVVAEQIESSPAKSAAPGGPADADLQALVDETPEGFRFRNDLPFPTQVTVNAVSRSKMKTRSFSSSALGTEARTFDGEVESEVDVTLMGSRATVVAKDTNILVPSAEGEKKEPKKEVAVKGGSITMDRKKDGWVPVSDGKALDFSLAGRFAGPGFEQFLTDYGLLARPFWFGKKRLKIGDEVTLEGDHLEMLGFKKSSGTIRLKFERTEAVHGHPCGVFSISGSAANHLSEFLGASGGEEDMTIESGMIWLSLLYPIGLKEDLNAVVSIRAGKGKENLRRSDGKSNIIGERKWKNSAGAR